MNRQDSLAAIVRHERRERGWSQDQLAGAAGLNLRTVQRVERGSSCSGDTLQALASALDLSASILTRAAPDTRRRSRALYLSSSQSMWIGAALCLPALIFVVSNVAYYELELTIVESFITSAAWNSMVGSQFSTPLILGGPAIAFVLNVPHLVQLRANTDRSMTMVSGLIFRWSHGQWLVSALAFILLVTMLVYGAIENLHHMIHYQ